MSNIFDEVAVAERVTVAMPAILAEARTIIADLKLVLDHADRIVTMIEAAVQQPKAGE
jgi:hypothetical protein